MNELFWGSETHYQQPNNRATSSEALTFDHVAAQLQYPKDKPISKIIMENHVGRAHGLQGIGCITKLPRIPIIETTQWHAGPILYPAVKMKPYSVLCRPSVSLLKPKNKD